MPKSKVVNGTHYRVHTNRHVRELMSLAELPKDIVEKEFSYVEFSPESDDLFNPRFFNYRGSWYDTYEFTRAGNDIKALGFDDAMSDSYWSCTAVCYFDQDGYALDGAVIVGFIHW